MHLQTRPNAPQHKHARTLHRWQDDLDTMGVSSSTALPAMVMEEAPYGTLQDMLNDDYSFNIRGLSIVVKNAFDVGDHT